MTLIFSQIVWMWPLNLLMCPFELYMFIGVSMQLSSNVLIPYCWSVALEKKKKKKKSPRGGGGGMVGERPLL